MLACSVAVAMPQAVRAFTIVWGSSPGDGQIDMNDEVAQACAAAYNVTPDEGQEVPREVLDCIDLGGPGRL